MAPVQKKLVPFSTAAFELGLEEAAGGDLSGAEGAYLGVTPHQKGELAGGRDIYKLS